MGKKESANNLPKFIRTPLRVCEVKRHDDENENYVIHYPPSQTGEAIVEDYLVKDKSDNIEDLFDFYIIERATCHPSLSIEMTLDGYEDIVKSLNKQKNIKIYGCFRHYNQIKMVAELDKGEDKKWNIKY